MIKRYENAAMLAAQQGRKLALTIQELKCLGYTVEALGHNPGLGVGATRIGRAACGAGIARVRTSFVGNFIESPGSAVGIFIGRLASLFSRTITTIEPVARPPSGYASLRTRVFPPRATIAGSSRTGASCHQRQRAPGDPQHAPHQHGENRRRQTH